MATELFCPGTILEIEKSVVQTIKRNQNPTISAKAAVGRTKVS